MFQIKIRIQPLHLDKTQITPCQVYVAMHVLRLLQLYYLLHPHVLPLPLIIFSHNGIYKRTPAMYFIIICYDNKPPQFLSIWVQVTTDVITLDTVM